MFKVLTNMTQTRNSTPITSTGLKDLLKDKQTQEKKRKTLLLLGRNNQSYILEASSLHTACAVTDRPLPGSDIDWKVN